MAQCASGKGEHCSPTMIWPDGDAAKDAVKGEPRRARGGAQAGHDIAASRYAQTPASVHKPRVSDRFLKGSIAIVIVNGTPEFLP